MSIYPAGSTSEVDLLLDFSILNNGPIVLTYGGWWQVAHALGIDRRGDAFLVACSREGRELKDVLEFLSIVFDPTSGFSRAPAAGYDVLVATSDATRLAALALRDLGAAGRIPPVFPATRKGVGDGDAAWLAFRLAVASFVVPDFVSRTPPNGGLDTVAHLRLLSFFKKYAGATPIRNFLMRCLVSKVDEQGLSALSDQLPPLVGTWVAPYLRQQIDSGMRALLAVPHFQERVDEGSSDQGPEALASALGGASLPQVHTLNPDAYPIHRGEISRRGVPQRRPKP
jgi:hypothetical protein